MPSVRVRFAPSPTGLLHVGGLRTALYNYLFARQNGGAFVLRIEDTDRERLVDEAETDILESLAWAGLTVDEGPESGGSRGPYRQSDRRETYEQHARRLLEAGHAYYAFDSPDQLDAMRERRADGGDVSAKYDASTRTSMVNSLTLSADEVERRIAAGDPYVIRLRVPEAGTISFEDMIRGPVSFDATSIDDQILMKSDGMPTYHLANVIDDHLMEITHVIRGEEWLPSTPKHVLLYQSFGWDAPQMAHLPLILSPAGGKLSKRNSEKLGIPVSVRDYRRAGYEPEALLNFLAFLGWNPGDEREVFTLEELVTAFSLDRVGSSGVQFNLEKLNWYNQQHLKRSSPALLSRRAQQRLAAKGVNVNPIYLEQVARLMQDRITFADELVTSASYFFEDPLEYEGKGVEKRWKDDAADLVRSYAVRLTDLSTLTEMRAEEALRELAEERGVGAGRIIHPVRLAISGVTFGPGLFDMIALLGRDTVVRRLYRAAEVLG